MKEHSSESDAEFQFGLRHTFVITAIAAALGLMIRFYGPNGVILFALLYPLWFSLALGRSFKFTLLEYLIILMMAAVAFVGEKSMLSFDWGFPYLQAGILLIWIIAAYVYQIRRSKSR